MWIRHWWRLRKMILLPLTGSTLSAVFAIGAFIIAVGAVPLALAYPLGWILTAIGFVSAVIYFADHTIARYLMRSGPIFESGIRPEDFLNAPTVPTSEYRLVSPANSDESQLYPYVDLSHNSAYIRAANDLTRSQRTRLYQRWYRLCPDGFLHLEKLVGNEWRPIAISIALPLSLEGYASIAGADKDEQTRVIDLGHGSILPALDRRHRILLIDTWIVDRAFKGIGHGKTQTSGGFANTMVLRHIAQFWNSRNRFPQVTFVAETNNKHLTPELRALTFLPAGHSKINADFYALEKTAMRGLRPLEFERLINAMKAIGNMPVRKGTAPYPKDWETTFPHRG